MQIFPWFSKTLQYQYVSIYHDIFIDVSIRQISYQPQL